MFIVCINKVRLRTGREIRLTDTRLLYSVRRRVTKHMLYIYSHIYSSLRGQGRRVLLLHSFREEVDLRRFLRWELIVGVNDIMSSRNYIEK